MQRTLLLSKCGTQQRCCFSFHSNTGAKLLRHKPRETSFECYQAFICNGYNNALRNFTCLEFRLVPSLLFKEHWTLCLKRHPPKLEALQPEIELVFLLWWMSGFYSKPLRQLRCDPKWWKWSIQVSHTDQLNLLFSIFGHFNFRVRKYEQMYDFKWLVYPDCTELSSITLKHSKYCSKRVSSKSPKFTQIFTVKAL